MDAFVCRNCGSEVRSPRAPVQCASCGQKRIGLFRQSGQPKTGAVRQIAPPPPPPTATSMSSRNDAATATVLIDDLDHVARSDESAATRKIEATKALPTDMGTFGRYEFIRPIGKGAMGTVYLARDIKLDRQVALKVPQFSDEDSEESVERFYREARAMAMLRHPNLCPVFDVDDVDGIHYMTMAFIEGKTLAEMLQTGTRFSGRQVAEIMMKVAQALHVAHQAGVIHRDLKPANIMIDTTGEPVILDFGIARRENTDDAQLTQAGTVVGTPGYLAPELLNETAPPGQASDVYSLGIIMYEVLTGKRPFRGSVSTVIAKILTVTPAPPSELRDVDALLEAICLKAIARELDSRFSTAQEMASALQAYMTSDETA